MNFQTLGFIFGAVLLLMFLAAVMLARRWHSMPVRAQRDFAREMGDQQSTVLLLAAIALLPAVLAAGIQFMLQMQWSISPAPFGLAGALLWALAVVIFWQRRAMPFQANVFPTIPIPPAPRVPKPLVLPQTPRPAVPLPIPKLEDKDLVERTFTWTYGSDGSHWKIEMGISQSRYDSSRAEDRLINVQDWHAYIERDMPEIRVLAAHFQNIHLQRDWCTFDQASNVLAFVQQSIPYSEDEKTSPKPEWPRYPIETLFDRTGDCEDVAILTGAIIARLGFKVALLHYQGHVALGIAGADYLPGEYVLDESGKGKYFYAEGTAQGWHIGEIPPRYIGHHPEIIPVSILIAPSAEGKEKS